jgi:hypothetical protein
MDSGATRAVDRSFDLVTRGVIQRQEVLPRETSQMRSRDRLTGKPEVVLKWRLQANALFEPDCGWLFRIPGGLSPMLPHPQKRIGDGLPVTRAQ